MDNIKVKRISKVCLRVDINVSASQRGAKFLLTSDHHIDNPLCVRHLLKKDFDYAKNNDMGIFLLGDVYCVMQGKGDRRGAKDHVRPQHQTGAYLDSVKKEGSEFFRKYADNIIMISPGNHEEKVRQYHEIDLITETVERVNTLENSNIQKMPYAGWIFFRFISGKNVWCTKKLAYSHGYGGGGPVTKGVIQTNRRSIYLPDAHMIATGHIHEDWVLTVNRERITNTGIPFIDQQLHIQLPTYKEEYLPGNDFHRERGRPPKHLGGKIIEFEADFTHKQIKIKTEQTWQGGHITADMFDF